MLKNKFTYIPALSTGDLGNSLKKNSKLLDGTTCRFYTEDFYSDLIYPYFLITAGHLYKKPNLADEWGLKSNPDMYLFADSGGFQIATGALQWSIGLRDQLFQWLQNNSTVAANIDIPPKIGFAGKFNDALDISYDNFKYFDSNQTGATTYLNVLHGTNLSELNLWYNKVKEFEFGGWSIGSTANSIVKMVRVIALLHQHGEFNKSNIKYLHFLGSSKIDTFILLSSLQKYFNINNIDIKVTSDSSTPAATRFGYYYIGANYKKNNYIHIHCPKIRGADPKSILFDKYTMGDYARELNNHSLVETNRFDKYLEKAYEKNDVIEYNARFSMILTLHNMYQLIDSVDFINKTLEAPLYTQFELFGSNMIGIVHALNDILNANSNGSTPLKELSKHEPKLITIEKLNNPLQTINHEFFKY